MGESVKARRFLYILVCLAGALILLVAPVLIWAKIGLFLFPRHDDHLFGIILLPLIVTYLSIFRLLEGPVGDKIDESLKRLLKLT